MSVNIHYATLDIVKQKLRIPEDNHTIDAELETYASEVDQYVDRHLKRKLGSFDQNGDPITLPLSEDTYPVITEDLRVVADDLLEGKFRLKTTNDTVLWDNARQQLQEYLDMEFGWTENKPFRKTPSITITPTSGAPSSTITITGKDFANVETLEVIFGGVELTPTPDPLVSSSTGTFTGATVIVPSTAEEGVKEFKVRSSSAAVDVTAKNLPLTNVAILRFQVT